MGKNSRFVPQNWGILSLSCQKTYLCFFLVLENLSFPLVFSAFL
ncbi:hypothetical protein HMPREF3293_00153 [Christensenella minuta]|uniref:Uncharacterized protein n=1 Tax=Christensenella minuta TaxID=626937 RepID=A0A136Q8K4_9FIRM|nr:hypothetical protein HMPREF3293_00153 [Christensenella minuta]